MPYEGDSPIEAWEYWFDEPPSEAVRLCLGQRTRRYSADLVVESIAATGRKTPLINGDEDRLKYLSGVLRRKALNKIDPERAEEERIIDTLQTYWSGKHEGSLPLAREQIRDWLRFATSHEIKVLMSTSDDREDLAELIKKYRAAQVAEADAMRADIRSAAAKLTIVPKNRE